MPDLKLSDDGMYYWDGAQWVSTLSHDGRSRWNGREWVPLASVPAPVYGRPQHAGRVPTAWTRPLQYAVAGWYLIQAIWAVVVPFLLRGAISDYTNQILQRNQQLNPTAPPLPPDFESTLGNIMTVALVVGTVIGVAISVVVIVGALQRWTWMYYVVLVLLGFGTLSLPFSVISALIASPLSNPVSVPPALTWSQIIIGIPGAAIFIWMLVAIIRYGPWAMARAQEGATPAPR